jgi:RNA polymerase sigma factor (sigma-70 family)
MHASSLQGVLDYFRKLTDPARPRELSDADLLERFRLGREEAAFTLLVQRHGPMVLAVCRRILGDVYEAEDAFQATFLVLVRKAGTIRKQQSLAGWLHRVASHIAHKAGMRCTRQRVGQAFQPDIRDDPSETLAAAELRAALDEEIERLPDKYRTPLILCYLAEKTHEQAAAELGWPKSSVTARLARARELLQRRLIRRGFTAPAGLLAALLTEQAANATIPSVLALSSVRLAVQALAGETLTATSAAALAGSFVKGTMVLKLAAAMALLATLGLAAVGYRMAVPACSSPSGQAAPKSKTPGERRKSHLDLFGDPLPPEAVARMGSGRLRHSGHGGQSIFFSPDSKQLISSAPDGLRFWDTQTGKLLRRLDFRRGNNLTSCRYVGGQIICANVGAKWIAEVQVLDAATGQVRRRVPTKESAHVRNPILSPDGKRLAVAHQNEIRLYDTTTGEAVQHIPVKGAAAWSMAFAPDGKTIAFNDLSTDAIYLHDTGTGKLVREMKRPGDTTLQLVFSPDGRFLAAMPQGRFAAKGEVSIWNVHNGKEVHRWTHPFPKAMSAAFSADGKRVAIGGVMWGLVLWDVETGKEIRRSSPHGGVLQIALSPDGKLLATASPRGAICLWDAATGKLMPASADADVPLVDRLHFSADAKRLFGDAGACLIWDAATGRELQRFTDPKPLDFKHRTDLHCLALSPDESLLAAARPYEPIVLWDLTTGKEKHTLKGDDYTLTLLFAADGRRLISSGDKNLVRVWDTLSGRQLHQLPGRTPLTVSVDGRLLAAADANMMNVLVYDLATGRETKRFSIPQSGMPGGSTLVFDLAFAPEGRSLAAACYLRAQRAVLRGIIKLWDLTGSERVSSFEGTKMPMRSVAFSPDGRTLATGDHDGAVILWEVSSGRRRHAFVGHEGEIHDLVFSPNGRTLAASSADAPVYVWDVTGSLQSNPHRLTKEELQRCWNALIGEDASAAFQAIRRLAAAPEQTLPFLREHLKPVPPPDRKRIRQLVEMLDSADFPTRQQATEELEKQDDAAAGLLRQIVAKEKPSLEVRRRLQQIVEGIENKPESLRAVRAVEVLEWIATPEAVRLIDDWAGGSDARLTREASAAKRRLAR